MKRTALFLAALALVACETETADPSARAAELEIDADDDGEELDDAQEGRHGKRHRAHDGAGTEICEAVACTDAQQEQVKAIFARPERGERGERPERPDMSAADAALAKAFASEDFGEADLRARAEQVPARAEDKSHRLEAMSELHAVLTPEQRTAFAAKISAGEVFAGRGEGRRKHKGAEGDEHASRRIEHFCEPLDCSDEQKAELTEIFAAKRESGPDGQARKDALAAAFGADTFDADAVRDSSGHDPAAAGAMLVEIHAVLSPEQRAVLAERIAERGPRLHMGKGGKHGRKGKHRGRRGDCDGGPDGGPEFG